MCVSAKYHEPCWPQPAFFLSCVIYSFLQQQEMYKTIYESLQENPPALPNNAIYQHRTWGLNSRKCGGLYQIYSVCLLLLYHGHQFCTSNSFHRPLQVGLHTKKLCYPSSRLAPIFFLFYTTFKPFAGWYDNDVDLSRVLELSWLIRLPID